MHRRLAMLIVLSACRDPAPAPAVDAGVADVVTAVEPRRPEAKPEAGALVDARCEGMSLSLFETACEVPDAEWVATPAPEAGALRQEAKREPNAGIVFSIVNTSAKPVLVPLRFDLREPGKSFSLIAEDKGGQGIYALVPPRVIGVGGADLPSIDGGARLHSTRIKLSPGGRASTTLDVRLGATERLDKRDAGLPQGQLLGVFDVHIGQLFSHVEMGDPAKVHVLNQAVPRKIAE